jgi:hypothetical protein
MKKDAILFRGFSSLEVKTAVPWMYGRYAMCFLLSFL